MNDPNTFGYQENPAALAEPGRAPLGGPNAMAQYKFSPEELSVLEECNKESFVQRSLPLGTVLGLGTFAAVQTGYLRPNPRFGAFPKVSLAVVAGYFLGKLSYQQACAEKLMALPGSYIGQLLRDRRDGLPPPGRSAIPGGGAPGGMLGATQADIYSDAGPGWALDLDTDRPGYIDDPYHVDREVTLAGPLGGAPEAAARPTPSYDELRRQNRGQHADAKQDPYRVEGGRRGPPPPAPRSPPPPPANTNRYGDAMD